MRTWKVAAAAAVLLTVAWLLSPARSPKYAAGSNVVEISYMRESGLFTDAVSDAIRVFEAESEAAHRQDPSRPILRVISGQNASRNQTEDPTRFLVSVAGDMPPDVIRFDRFAVTEWASRGAFRRLDEFLARDLEANRPDAIRQEDFYKPCWAEVVFRHPVSGETGVFGIPEDVDNRALFYNKDLLQRAGYDRPPQNWSELKEMAIALTERDSAGRITRLGFAPNFGNSWLYMYAFQKGGEFMSADGRRCTLNEPRIVAALEWMTEIYDALGGAQAVNAFQSSAGASDLDPFVTGRVAMKIDGFWFLSTLAQFGEHLNYAVAPPPLPDDEVQKGRAPISWVSGWCHAIPSTAKHPEAAWELIRFLSSPRAAEIMAESARLSLQSQGQTFLPKQHSVVRINAWLADIFVYKKPSSPPKLSDAVRTFNDLIENSPIRPVTPVGQLLWNKHIDATESAIFHKLSAQEALDRATRDVQRELDRVLQPPRGMVLRWTPLIILYVVLLIVVAVAVFLWDTNGGFQRAIRSRLSFRREREPGGGPLREAAVEGTRSAYFRSQWRGGWLCALPWIIGFVVFTGGPILFSIAISFSDYDVLNPPRVVGLGNYAAMFTQDPLFWKALGNTFYMVLGVPLGMALSLAIAMLLNLNLRGVGVWRTVFYLPSIVPAVAASILWIWIFNPNAGLLNGVLSSFGIHGPNWLQNENTSKLSLILMGLWSAGGGMIVWLAGLKGISETYYEAAALDGAGSWRKFLYVTLPLLSPYIFFNLIMGLIGTFQIFTQAFIMTQGGPVNSTLFYAYHLFNNAFRYLHMGYACAMGWFLFLIVFGLTMIQMKLSERWVHYEEG